jgi:hypothetical protein
VDDPGAERAEARRRTVVWGTPDQVQQRLTALATEHGVDEIMVNTLTCDPVRGSTASRTDGSRCSGTITRVPGSSAMSANARANRGR